MKVFGKAKGQYEGNDWFAIYLGNEITDKKRGEGYVVVRKKCTLDVYEEVVIGVDCEVLFNQYDKACSYRLLDV